MQNITQKLVSGGQRTLLISSLAIVMLSALIFGPATQSASAVTCRQQNIYPVDGGIASPDSEAYYQRTGLSDGYEALHTVPPSSVSGCSYINVKNITGGWGAGGNCWSFRIYYPYSTPDWSYEVGACAGPNTVTGISTVPVANGTQYAVVIIPNDNLRFILRD